MNPFPILREGVTVSAFDNGRTEEANRTGWRHATFGSVTRGPEMRSLGADVRRTSH